MEELVYAVTEEETQASSRAVEAARARRDSLRKRRDELDEMPDSPEVLAEKDGIYRELVRMAHELGWQNYDAYWYIDQLMHEHRYDELISAAEEETPGYYLWAHCEDEAFERDKIFQLSRLAGMFLYQKNEYARALPYFQMALREFKLWLAEDGNAFKKEGSLFSLLVSTLYSLGQIEAAGPVADEGIHFYEDLQKRLTAEEYIRLTTPSARRALVECRVDLLLENGELAEGRRILENYAGALRILYEASPEEMRDAMMESLYLLGTFLFYINEFDEAGKILREALSMHAPGGAMEPETAVIRELLACNSARQGKRREAEEMREKAKELRERSGRTAAGLPVGSVRDMRSMLFSHLFTAEREGKNSQVIPAFRLREEDWRRIREAVAPGLPFRDVIAVSDESMMRDMSSGFVFAVQGIWARKGLRAPVFYPWNDVEKTKTRQDKALGLLLANDPLQDNYHWYPCRKTDEIKSLLGAARDVLNSRKEMGSRKTAPEKIPEDVMRPEAVFQRFGVKEIQRA